MDALWRVLDVVLRYEEFQLVGAGEAFVLGASFYVHDLGMALACTTDGARTLRGTESFKRQVEKLSRLGVVAPERIDQLALEAAARETHADAAMLIAQSELPGLKRYLIEDSQLRERWGQLIGEVSASHGSSLRQLETSLGIRGRIPDAIGGTIDPGYLACVLRITDYAHINHERAGTLRRLVRGAIREESLKHWLAQASVSGPSREDTQLVYASLGPISEVDAWWQFYELARGLDVEIADVGEYLAGRAGSNGRFSLTGVKSATTPQAFARLVRPADFDPVDVRFRSDSMDRLVDLLGGRSLYGEDRFVPIRELIQNARDAVHLFAATLPDAERGYYSPRVDVGVEQTSETGVLAVTDNGIGMSRYVATRYLLSVASNYWRSDDYHAEFSGRVPGLFTPVGRFGIGFLSVFMLGSNVTVKTQRRGDEELLLRLYGVGRRGSLRSGVGATAGGTSVRVEMPLDQLREFDNLATRVRARAPMLDVPVSITQDSQSTVIDPGWWRTLPQSDFLAFVEEQRRFRHRDGELIYDRDRRAIYLGHSGSRTKQQAWVGECPEWVQDSGRVLAMPGHQPLMICAQGFAVQIIGMSGFTGMVDVGNVGLNAARSEVLGWDVKRFRASVLSDLAGSIVAALDRFATVESIPAHHEFLAAIGRSYGVEMLTKTRAPWVTVLEPPGHARLINCAELTRRLQQTDECLVTYGPGPWNAYQRARARYPEASASAIVVVVSSDGQPSVGNYREEEEVFRMPLWEHFAESAEKRGDRAQVPLLEAIVDTVSAAWAIRDRSSLERDWCRHRQALFGHLRKPR